MISEETLKRAMFFLCVCSFVIAGKANFTWANDEVACLFFFVQDKSSWRNSSLYKTDLIFLIPQSLSSRMLIALFTDLDLETGWLSDEEYRDCWRFGPGCHQFMKKWVIAVCAQFEETHNRQVIYTACGLFFYIKQ